MDDLNLGAIESGESGASSKEGVSEQAMQKIQEEARQAKQVAQQLKKSKAANGQFAGFLSFLMKTLDDELVNQIYETFYLTTDSRTKITYLRKNANYIVITGMFFPFFIQEASKYNLHKLFGPLLPQPLTIKSYFSYLQEISNKYHDNIPIDTGKLINLLALILKNFLSQFSNGNALQVEGTPELAYQNIVKQYLC